MMNQEILHAKPRSREEGIDLEELARIANFAASRLRVNQFSNGEGA
jgi:hypothetical protein